MAAKCRWLLFITNHIRNKKMSKEYTTAVVIGRHQINHKGHDFLKSHALSIADNVIIILGSSFHSRDPRHPFRWQERRDMINLTLSEADRQRVTFIPARDYYNDTKWNAEVAKLVREHTPSGKVALVGAKKKDDQSTYYLDNFPQWTQILVESPYSIDASMLRKIYFEANNIDASLAVMSDMIEQPVLDYLRAWAVRPEYKDLVRDHAIAEQFKATQKSYKFHHLDQTGDAIVTINNHVLLGIRKNYGKGYLCIPGGFMETHEFSKQTALRELREETQLGLLDSHILNHWKGSRVYEHPQRSARGRIVTHAHLFQLTGTKFPSIEAADDLMSVEWVHIDKLASMEEDFFEDHFHILDDHFGIIKIPE